MELGNEEKEKTWLQKVHQGIVTDVFGKMPQR